MTSIVIAAVSHEAKIVNNFKHVSLNARAESAGTNDSSGEQFAISMQRLTQRTHEIYKVGGRRIAGRRRFPVYIHTVETLLVAKVNEAVCKQRNAFGLGGRLAKRAVVTIVPAANGDQNFNVMPSGFTDELFEQWRVVQQRERTIANSAGNKNA